LNKKEHKVYGQKTISHTITKKKKLASMDESPAESFSARVWVSVSVSVRGSSGSCSMLQIIRVFGIADCDCECECPAQNDWRAKML